VALLIISENLSKDTAIIPLNILSHAFRFRCHQNQLQYQKTLSIFLLTIMVRGWTRYTAIGLLQMVQQPAGVTAVRTHQSRYFRLLLCQ
jgi:hypothetical protein